MNEWTEVLRKAEVKRRTTLSNTLLHELLKAGAFPQPSYLTTSSRIPVWNAKDVDQWITARLGSRKCQQEAAQ